MSDAAAAAVAASTRVVDGACRVVVRAKPKSAREGIAVEGDAIVVRVRAAPADGAANERVLAVVADALGVPQRAVSIVRGATARHKELAVDGVSLDDVRARLRAADAA